MSNVIGVRIGKAMLYIHKDIVYTSRKEAGGAMYGTRMSSLSEKIVRITIVQDGQAIEIESNEAENALLISALLPFTDKESLDYVVENANRDLLTSFAKALEAQADE